MTDVLSTLSNKATIVCDVDEVLCNITPKWLNLAYKAGLTVTDRSPEEVLARSEYYIDYLCDPTRTPELISLYMDNPTFYDDLQPTPFALSLIRLQQVKPNVIGKLHLVTKCGKSVDLPTNHSKRAWLELLFKDFPADKIEYHFITEDQPKDMIFNFCKEIDILIDDKPQNIADILLAKPDDCKIKTVVMPKLGYSALPPICHAYAKVNNTAIMYYNNIM